MATDLFGRARPLFGAVAAPGSPASRRSGPTRINRRVLEDDGGPFNPLTITGFPFPYLFRRERARLQAEARALVTAGCVDGVRTFTGVAGESWADRIIPTDDVDAVIDCAGLAYEEHGLRLAHTIFADGPDAPAATTRDERKAIVREYGAKLRGREARFLAIEIVNENYDGKLDVAELRELGRRLQDSTSVPVILSAPSTPENFVEMYHDSPVALANMHGERNTRSVDGGRFEPLWKPYEYPWRGGIGQPSACAWLEPIGPGSSVDVEYDPMRLVLHFVTTHLLGATLHDFHPAAGIRLGGEWDRRRGLPARYEDTPLWDEIVAGFRAARAYTPAGVANWGRIAGHRDECAINFRRYRKALPDGGADNGPFDDGTVFKSAVAEFGNQLFGVILRLRRPIDIAPRHAADLEVLDPLTGNVLQQRTLSAGEWWTVTPRSPHGWEFDGDGLVLRGRWR